MYKSKTPSPKKNFPLFHKSSIVISIDDFLRLVYNCLEDFEKPNFDIGDFLETNNYKRDLSNITKANLDTLIKDWSPVITEDDELDYFSISSLFEDGVNKCINFDVSNMGFKDTEFITNNKLYEIIDGIYSYKKLSYLILPAPAVEEKFNFNYCTIEKCHINSDKNINYGQLFFTNCSINDISIKLSSSQICIKNCTGKNIQITQANGLTIKNSSLTNIEIIDCEFLHGVKLINSYLHLSFIKGNVFYSTYIYKIKGLNDEHCKLNIFRKKDDIINAASDWDWHLNNTIKSEDSTIPNIAVSYNFNDSNGTDNLLQPYIERQKLNSKGCRIIYLDNQEPFENITEILSELRINLVLLPGGENVPKEYYTNATVYSQVMDTISGEHKRTNFELNLTRWAENSSIPIVGICRGLQVLAVYFGMELKNVPHAVEHCNDSNLIFCSNIVEDNNIVYNECARKYHKHSNNKEWNISQIITENDEIAYLVKKKCQHSQCINIETINEAISISAMSSDNIIECAQFKSKNNSIILGWQSHPERIYAEDKMSQAFIKLTIKIANQHNFMQKLMFRRNSECYRPKLNF